MKGVFYLSLGRPDFLDNESSPGEGRSRFGADPVDTSVALMRPAQTRNTQGQAEKKPRVVKFKDTTQQAAM